MKHISRLERLEALASRQSLVPTVSVLTMESGAHKLIFGLWSGKPGSGRTVTSYHDTEGAALDKYNKLLERYPARPEPALIVIDVGAGHENR